MSRLPRWIRWLPAYVRWYLYAFATTYLRQPPSTVPLKASSKASATIWPKSAPTAQSEAIVHLKIARPAIAKATCH